MKNAKTYLSVLYKHIIQVENKNVGLKVCVCVGWGGGASYASANYVGYVFTILKTFE